MCYFGSRLCLVHPPNSKAWFALYLTIAVVSLLPCSTVSFYVLKVQYDILPKFKKMFFKCKDFKLKNFVNHSLISKLDKDIIKLLILLSFDVKTLSYIKLSSWTLWALHLFIRSQACTQALSGDPPNMFSLSITSKFISSTFYFDFITSPSDAESSSMSFIYQILSLGFHLFSSLFYW